MAPPEVPALPARLGWRDVLGGWRVRWGIGRMRYAVAPGLYRVGAPGPASPVLVTANYKLTVDTVRRWLAGISAWLLVLDTKGVNVWCSAGKGAFGAAELARRIDAVHLRDVVTHRDLVLPQLAATGVAAHEVKRATGFSVHYGPVRARDIGAYLAGGMMATPEMRCVRFGWKDRLAVAPVEIVAALGPLAAVLSALLALDLLHHHRVTARGLAGMIPFAAAVLAGGLAVPWLLPWIPFRSFALKGAVAGALAAAAVLPWLPLGPVALAGSALLTMAIVSYMALMFTGSTTFTTLAGVRLEVRRALPPILLGAGAGALLRIAGEFF
jgi:hypothetical protein